MEIFDIDSVTHDTQGKVLKNCNHQINVSNITEGELDLIF